MISAVKLIFIKRIQRLTVPVFLLTLIACNNGKENRKVDVKVDVKDPTASQTIFDKLVGEWQSEDGKTFEQWIKNENGTYESRVYSVKGTDTSWNEQAKIYRENDKWIFENTVKGQNDGRPVKFTSSILTDSSIQFTNPVHDFPTDVNYSIADENTIHAFIIGPNKKEGRDTIFFNYKRIKQ